MNLSPESKLSPEILNELFQKILLGEIQRICSIAQRLLNLNQLCTHFRITPGLPVLPPSLANNHVGGGVDDMGNGGSALTGNGTGLVNIAIFP